MKNVLTKYLNKRVVIDKESYTLNSVEHDCIVVNGKFGKDYIPYTSIFKISETSMGIIIYLK